METGFPSPAQGYEEIPIDLGSYLVPRPVSTFFMRIDTNRYSPQNIFKDDILVIDRSLPITENALCVASNEDGFCLINFENKYHKSINNK